LFFQGVFAARTDFWTIQDDTDAPLPTGSELRKSRLNDRIEPLVRAENPSPGVTI
jgi:hypothetical protein